ncbi:MAG: LacI family DNA-binding transcriptional regulator [Streptococcaceae bacterium]|nr:LacI family DNA-binding transcriptional regulator [Streptococcaceae bacterium]MCH4177429.1 LacI family DNA-binding transcriptional regulator [Streptococcaceae bacterium]
MASIREIARLAGVSPATVSRVLNHDETMSTAESTRERIFAIANQLNYQTVNQSPKKSIQKKSRMSIAVIKIHDYHRESDDPYFHMIHKGMIDEATNWKIRLESIYINDFMEAIEHLTDFGAIIVVGNLTDEAYELIYQKNSNLIIIDDYFASPKYDLVHPDFGKKTTEVLDWLYANNHRNIAFIGGENRVYNSAGESVEDAEDVRTIAYKNWMKLKGLENFINVKITGWGIEQGLDQAVKLIEEGVLPTAIVSASDPLSIGIYRAFQTHHLSIGKDISIFSFDDIEMAAYLTPSLSTVHIDSHEIGRVAVRLAKERIVDQRKTALRVEVASELIIRESSQKI